MWLDNVRNREALELCRRLGFKRASELKEAPALGRLAVSSSALRPGDLERADASLSPDDDEAAE